VNKYAECNVKQRGDVEWPVKNTGMVEMRTAQPGDNTAIQEVHTVAFGGPVEAKLVKLICERKKALLSLVALRDGTVVAHILFSQVTVATVPEGFKAVGLAPVAVLPQFQRQGIGSMLVRKGLEQCKHAGYDVVVLVGDPAYYSRFGFLRAADFGLQNEYGVLDEFMVLQLRDGALGGVKGMVKYLPEFQEVGC
jgi:putative acetyltransferase